MVQLLAAEWLCTRLLGRALRSLAGSNGTWDFKGESGCWWFLLGASRFFLVKLAGNIDKWHTLATGGS